MIELITPRLVLRELRTDDAPFIVTLLSDSDFVRYIGDRGVRTLDQAREYALNGPIKSYSLYGFGLLVVQARGTGTTLGLCGLVQRDYLPDPDLGFAFLPEYRAQGFCAEAAQAVLDDAARTFKRVAAIVQPDNTKSLALLTKLGFVIDRKFKRSIDERELLVLARFS